MENFNEEVFKQIQRTVVQTRERRDFYMKNVIGFGNDTVIKPLI